MSHVSFLVRALCVADGNDSEALIELGGETVDVDQTTWHREATVASWTSYVGKAERIMAACVCS